MKIYEKPAIDIAVINNKDVITLSGGGLTDRFNRITNSESNSIQLD